MISTKCSNQLNHRLIAKQLKMERSYPGAVQPHNVKPHPGALNYDWEPQVFISGDPHPCEINNAYNQWMDARQKLFRNIQTILQMRADKGVLRLDHGVNIILYGVSLTYNAYTKDWRGVVVDTVGFLEHLVGILKITIDIRNLNKEFVDALCNLESQPAIHIHHVNPNNGVWA